MIYEIARIFRIFLLSNISIVVLKFYMDVKKQFSQRLKLLRKAKGLSQDELALAIGRTKETVSHLERGLSFPNAETFDRLCKELSFPAREFFAVTIEEGLKQQKVDEITIELSELDVSLLEICLDQIRALTKNRNTQ